ncbi:arylesterase [Candidatus Kaiserbacteria bacterium]|nr:arylesterase [Candidatus Kaiserbacteria bacterium]
MSIRRIIILFVGLAALALGYYFFFQQEEAAITNYPSAGADIIAFGDSLVSGSGATPGKDFVSLLSARVGESIVNLGVPGDTTADGLARIEALDRYKPKVVLLLLGGNDYLRRVPRETIFANLGKIIEEIHARGAVVILLGVKGSLFGDAFEQQFETLRDRYGTAYVPNVLDGVFADSRYMADAIHPNDAGNQIIANRIYPILATLLY